MHEVMSTKGDNQCKRRDSLQLVQMLIAATGTEGGGKALPCDQIL
jgi:hypothetical protein